MHNDLIMSAKQKRLKASDFIGARVTSLQLSPIRWKDCGPEACDGLRRHHAEGLDSAPQDRNVQGWDCRSLRHGNPEMLQPGVSEILGTGLSDPYCTSSDRVSSFA